MAAMFFGLNRIMITFIYAVLISYIYGYNMPSATYYVSANSSANYQCPTNVTSCHIYCNVPEHQNHLVFDCKNALKCYFHCNAKLCGAHSMVNAISAKTLYITQTSPGTKCLYKADVRSPHDGSAYLSSHSTKGFQYTQVFAGPNTKEIVIDTSYATPAINGSEYMGMNVFAANAYYLRINIGNKMQWMSSTVECPVHSSYNGPDAAPCMINASGATMDNINIVAQQGTPKNVIVEGCAQCDHVQITCIDIDIGVNLDEYPFVNTSNCWWTNEPTFTPTTAPTLHVVATAVSVTEHAPNTNKNSFAFLPFPTVYFIIAVVGAIVCLVVCCCIVYRKKKKKNKEENDLKLPKKGTITDDLEAKIQMELCYNVPYVTVTKTNQVTESIHIEGPSSWTYTGFANLIRRFTPASAKSPESNKTVVIHDDSDDEQNLQDKQ